MRRFRWIKITISSTILVVFVAIGSYVYLQKDNDALVYEFVIAQKKDLIQYVSVTGTVKPVEQVNLAFEVTGRVESIFADIGDFVKKNTPLIKLVNTDLTSELAKAQADLQNQRAQLSQLQAAVEVEKARLDELNTGTRVEEVNVIKIKLDNAKKETIDAELNLSNTITLAQKDLQNLYTTAKNTINDAYLSIDDTIRIKTDDLFSDSFSNSGDLVFIVSEQSTEADARDQRRESAAILDKLSKQVLNLPSNNADLDILLVNTQADLLKVQNYLVTLSLAITQEVNLEDSLKSVFQTNINAARTSITSVKNQLSSNIQQIESQKIINNNKIDSAQNALNTSQNAVTLAEEELLLAQAGTIPQQIRSQNARIDQAEANALAQEARILGAISQVNIVQTNLEKTILRSPIDGVITKLDSEIGEIVALNERLSPTIVSIISDSEYEITAYIPEADIAKVHINDVASITLDAYSDDDHFEVEVAMIDPAETIIEGVPTYKVTFVFTEPNEKIRSGMTANIEILTAEADNVISIPQRTVISENGRKYVRVVVDNAIEQRDVKTGLVSWDGQVEITEGLRENEQVVTFIES